MTMLDASSYLVFDIVAGSNGAIACFPFVGYSDGFGSFLLNGFAVVKQCQFIKFLNI